MKTLDEWTAVLRARLTQALREKDKAAVAVLRETLAALDNAQAPPLRQTAAGDGVFAFSASGVGAGDAERLALSPQAVAALIDKELAERRTAAATYVKLGRHEEAATLSGQAELLAALRA